MLYVVTSYKKKKLSVFSYANFGLIWKDCIFSFDYLYRKRKKTKEFSKAVKNKISLSKLKRKKKVSFGNVNICHLKGNIRSDIC